MTTTTVMRTAPPFGDPSSWKLPDDRLLDDLGGIRLNPDSGSSSLWRSEIRQHDDGMIGVHGTPLLGCGYVNNIFEMKWVA